MWLYAVVLVGLVLGWAGASHIPRRVKAVFGAAIGIFGVWYLASELTQQGSAAIGGDSFSPALLGSLILLGVVLYLIGLSGAGFLPWRILEMMGVSVLVAVFAIPSTFLVVLPLVAVFAAASVRMVVDEAELAG